MPTDPDDRPRPGTTQPASTSATRATSATPSTSEASEVSRGVTGWLALVVFLVIAFAAGWVGASVQGEDVGARYLGFDRPAWAPPQEAFGIVWPALYVLIGIAGWRTWKVAGGLRPAAAALGLWVAQLVINAIWPGIFFGINEFGTAIAVIVLLDVVVVATILAMRRIDRLAALLLVPYLLWILYATALNIALFLMN